MAYNNQQKLNLKPERDQRHERVKRNFMRISKPQPVKFRNKLKTG